MVWYESFCNGFGMESCVVKVYVDLSGIYNKVKELLLLLIFLV